MFFKRDRACVSRALLRMGFFSVSFFLKSWAPNTEILVFFFHIFFFVLLELIIKKSSSVYHQKQKSHISQVFFSTTKNDQWSSQLGSIFRRRDEPLCSGWQRWILMSKLSCYYLLELASANPWVVLWSVGQPWIVYNNIFFRHFFHISIIIFFLQIFFSTFFSGV